MKIIDLLNKIANGEEVPKKIKYEGRDMFYCEPCKIYELAEAEDGNLCGKDLYILLDDLNDEVEIIEEDKKIEKSDFQTSQIPPWFRNEKLIKVINNNFELQTQAIRLLIDELNRLKEKK